MSDIEHLPPNGTARLHIQVSEGLHAGVRIALGDGDYTIGSRAVEADILLRDEGVAPQHVVICVDGNDVRVEAIGGALRAGDAEIALGQGYRLRLPVRLRIGSASLQLTRRAGQAGIIDTMPSPSTFADTRVVLAASVAGCAAIGLLLWQGLQDISGNSSASTIATAVSPAQARTPASIGATADAGAAVQELQSRLSAAGIETLRVQADKTHITVTGALMREKAAAWNEIQRWFDTDYAPQLTLIANIVNPSQAVGPTMRLRAIWYGDRPYIIAENGIRYYEGAVLDGGWILQQITQDAVTTKKGNDVVTINLR